VKTIRKISEQQTVEARHHAATVNTHAGHWIHTSESATVRVQKVSHGK